MHTIEELRRKFEEKSLSQSEVTAEVSERRQVVSYLMGKIYPAIIFDEINELLSWEVEG